MQQVSRARERLIRLKQHRSMQAKMMIDVLERAHVLQENKMGHFDEIKQHT